MKLRWSTPSPVTDSSIRRYPRSIFTAPLTLRHLGAEGVRKLRGITLDVSEGGMGALVQGDLRLGEAVEVDLQLDEQVLNAVAIVRHTSSVRSGFEFLGMTSEERSRITEIMSRKPDPSRSARWAD
jgi:c-di-GMP-binding flagellar brake protein YcgR